MSHLFHSNISLRIRLQRTPKGTACHTLALCCLRSGLSGQRSAIDFPVGVRPDFLGGGLLVNGGVRGVIERLGHPWRQLQVRDERCAHAARIDGAKAWPRFFQIKLPLLAPSLAAIFLLKLILSFKIFDLIYVLTAGGPGVDTNLATFKIWRTLFQDFNLGLASAETVIFSLLVGLITIPVTWVNKKMQFAADL